MFRPCPYLASSRWRASWRLVVSLAHPYLQRKSRPNSLQAAPSYELVRFSPQSSVFAVVTAVLIKEAAALACNLESTSIAFRRVIHGRCTSCGTIRGLIRLED